MATDIAQANITNLAPETHPKVVRALISAFDNGDVTAIFSDELRDMANTTRAIKKGFEQVSQDLKCFDDRDFKKADRSPVGGLRPTWDAYFEDYKIPLRNSKKDALDLKFICDSMAGLLSEIQVLPNQTLDYLESILPALRDKTIPHERTSHYYAQAFGDLSRKLANFKPTLRDALNGAKGGIDAQLSSLDGSAQQLTESINKQRDVISATARPSGLLFLALQGGVAEFAIAKEQLKDSEEKLGLLDRERGDLKAQRRDVSELEKSLEACYDKIDSIALKVGAIGEFWMAVNVDAEMIIKKLNSVMAANSAYGTYALRKELGEKRVASLYMALQQPLLQYSKADAS
ncbi:hypothetical protein BDN72DRAFT_864571 [Pluteus cervinus]|uniref:Uncharacterized protein n=1 Tax=Pluteus cervinus TaxID=181527 RepID=A0ACD3A3R9_9AGAR|nr:hypothetical protein BDN72DRAFT_864571 [Pluteus cervinus]